MLKTRPLAIPDVVSVVPRSFADDRGFFAETYRQDRFAEHSVDARWMQDNQSFSTARHTLRGLHYQEPPFAQAKLVRVLRGRILDVAVDIRSGSPTFGRYVALELAPDTLEQLFIPAGFAHGFLTLEPDTEVFYKVDAPYSAQHDRSIRWNDPAIGIDWPLNGAEPVLSDKDRAAPLLADARPPFTV